jgi:hypothetical protein
MKSISITIFAILSIILGNAKAFSVQSKTIQHGRNSAANHVIVRNNNVRAHSAHILHAVPKYTMPSQEESVELGIREWPQQTKSSSWTDDAKEGQTLVRYILQGSGTVTVNGKDSRRFMTGMLMEVEGPVTLEWEKDDGEDVIILTPGYENGGLLVGAFLGFMGMVAALVALS